MVRGVIVATLVVLCAAGVASAGPWFWDVEILPDDPSWIFSFAEGMNEGADVVGRYGVGSERHAVLWEFGAPGFVDLETAFGPLPAGFVTSFAQAINDTGLVGGTMANGPLAPGTKQEAVVWNRNTSTNIPVHPGGSAFDSSRLVALNDSGIGVGHLIGFVGGFTPPQAYLWDVSDLNNVTGRLLPLPAGFGLSLANDVNESDYVVGWATAGIVSNALVWARDDTITNLHGKIVAAEGSITSTRAFGISDEGIVAGIGFGATFADRFAWTWDMATDTLTILDRGGTTSAVANDSAGEFVAGFLGAGAGEVAAVWRSGVLHTLDLHPLFGTMGAGFTNSNGYLAGRGIYPGVTQSTNGSRAYLAAPIPEPGTLALCGLGLAAGWLWRRRRGA